MKKLIDIIESFSPYKINISVDELVDIYQKKELVFDTAKTLEEQNWDNDTQSLFIENLLIGITANRIIVTEDSSSGTWFIQDGVQQMATILSYLNQLRNGEITGYHNQWKIGSVGFIGELYGLGYRDLPKKLKAFINGVNITVIVVRKSGDDYILADSLISRLKLGL
jgi:hypothetical protein